MSCRCLVLSSALLFTANSLSASVDANNTVQADRPILTCPIEQASASNGSAPDVELVKKIVRCKKGELAAAKGYDGAVTVDVSQLKVGQPRPWKYALDSGSGTVETIVYPVKVTYTVKTFYRSRIVLENNWMRIMNFYVDGFGEWRSGSEEPVKSPESSEIPN
jgi:hypothetical protein